MWLVLHPVATWTEKRKNIECCGCVIVCLLSICWQGKRRFCSDYLTVSYPARSQCYTHKHNSENFAHVLFVRKCVHALRESQQLFERANQRTEKKSPDGHQSASSAWPNLQWSAKAGVPLQEECVFISQSQDCENALYSDCSVTSNRFGKPKLAGSAFKLQFEDNILKEAYMITKANLQKCCENMFLCLMS